MLGQRSAARPLNGRPRPRHVPLALGVTTLCVLQTGKFSKLLFITMMLHPGDSKPRPFPARSSCVSVSPSSQKSKRLTEARDLPSLTRKYLPIVLDTLWNFSPLHSSLFTGFRTGVTWITKWLPLQWAARALPATLWTKTMPRTFQISQRRRLGPCVPEHPGTVQFTNNGTG